MKTIPIDERHGILNMYHRCSTGLMKIGCSAGCSMPSLSPEHPSIAAANLQAWAMSTYRLPIVYDGDVASVIRPTMLMARRGLGSQFVKAVERID